MKYKVGDKIKIVRATFGCCGAEGKLVLLLTNMLHVVLLVSKTVLT